MTKSRKRRDIQKKNKIFNCLILKKKKMFPLNIQLQSIEFIDKIVQDCDSIRVSVTTFPDEQKINTSFEVKQIRTTFPSFTVNVSDRTEKILIVFRKKYLVQRDPIIASTVITSDDLPKLINGSFDQEKEFDLNRCGQIRFPKKTETKNKTETKVLRITTYFNNFFSKKIIPHHALQTGMVIDSR